MTSAPTGAPSGLATFNVRLLRTLFVLGAGAVFLFYFHLAAFIPSLHWNVIEFELAKHLWNERHYGLAFDYPPALWRPPFPVIIIMLLERVVDNPMLTFRILVAISITSFVSSSYISGKLVGSSVVFGILGALLALFCPALITALLGSVHGLGHIILLGVLGPTIAVSLQTFRFSHMLPWEKSGSSADAGWPVVGCLFSYTHRMHFRRMPIYRHYGCLDAKN
jgi:hypothetical protein